MSTAVNQGRSTAAKPSAADRAYAKRDRRDRRLVDGGENLRFVRVGMPVRDMLTKIPFVIVLLVILAVGGVGVLYLNTRTDEMGIRTTDANEKSKDLRLRMESLQREINTLDSTPEIARKAKEMGLIQPKNGTILLYDAKTGKWKFVDGPAVQEPSAGDHG